MSLPRHLVVSCPGCEKLLEVDVLTWTVQATQHEEESGVAVEISGFVGHLCGEKDGL